MNRVQALFDISDLDFADEPNEIRMMTVRRSYEEFRLDDTDDDEQWTLAPGVSFNDEFHVRTVHASECTVILDSGADVSCIPPSFAECGRGASSRPLQVQDAQGATMKVKAERLIDFVVSDGDEGEVTIRERCIVADVTQPLLSLGRLLKRGWFPAKGNGSLWLHHESTGTSVPMGFKGMSLSMQASIRRVDVEESRVQETDAPSAPSSPSQKANAVSVQSSPMQKADAVSVQSSPVQQADAVSVQSSPVQKADAVSVRSSPVQKADAVSVQSSPHGPVYHVSHIQVRLSVDDLQYGWQVGPTGHLVWRGRSATFTDPSMFAPTGWPYRSTCAQRSGTWFLLEHCVPWTQIRDVEAPLPGGSECEVVTILHVQVEPISEVRVELPPGMDAPVGLPEPDYYSFYRSGAENSELVEVELDVEVPEEVVMEAGELAEASTGWAVLPEQQEPLAYAPQPPPAVEPTVLDGVEINEQTSSTVLKEAARKLGLSTAGSRSRLYQRVKSFLDKQRLGLEMQLAADAQQLEQREARVQPVPRQPTAQERLLHEATHLPFQPWCGHCVAMRSMPDRAESLVDAPRDIPTISYDFCFTGFDEEGKMEDCPAQDAENRRALKCMIIHDTATGSVAAVPCESKGDNKYLGLELMRFIQSLGHTTCELRCDAEQATLSLQTAVVRARLRLGMRAIVRNPAVGAHSSSGYVEKAVDCVRKLANTLLDMVREKTKLTIGTDSPLFSWAFIHAAFLLNRYRVTGNLTSYERSCGARYSGRIAPFGEPVYAQVTPKQKGNARWLLCVFLSKSVVNDMFIVGGRDGVRLACSIRRTGQPWALEQKLYNELAGKPWDYGSGVIGTRFVPLPRTRKPNVPALPEHPPGSGVGPLTNEQQDELHEPQALVAPDLLLPAAPPVPVSAPPPPGVAQAVPSGSMPSAHEPVEPNPAMRPLPPATPEALLPPLGPVSPAPVPGEPHSMDVSAGREPRAPEEPPRATKKLRLRAVQFGDQSYEVNDDLELDVDSQDYWDAETGLWAATEKRDPMDEDWAPAASDDRLWFPDTGHEPQLGAEELAALDMIADSVELSRLCQKGMIRPASDADNIWDMKSLSTKFVRTWRLKKVNGTPRYLRRSRLCAREFRWLDGSREGLFSPATSSSSDIIRLLPVLFLHHKHANPSTEYCLLSMDIKDAYLQVDQPVPVASKIQLGPGQFGTYIFEKMIPGQRDGSQQWFLHFIQFLSEHFTIAQCDVCPAVIKTPQGPGMVHVDDSLMLLPLQWALKEFLPVVKSKFEVTFDVASKPGDEFSFLKRQHVIMEDMIIIRPPPQYIEHMAEVLGVKPNLRQRTPCIQQLRDKDESALLSAADASKFRAGVGIALYISCDRPDIGYTIRCLASSMSSPTTQAMAGLCKLTQYLMNTAGYAIAIQANPPGTSKLSGFPEPGVEFVLEAFSDADWSGSKKDRRSYGGASYCLNGTYIHYICRAQKSVSLSSMEAEYYAAVGTASQGLFMQAVIEFMAETKCSLVVYLDNMSAKSFALRQGVSKAAKHIEGRLLWLQNVVQQRRLSLKFVPTHKNLGDLHTKPLAPARLLALLYLHDMVDGYDRPVGQTEFENVQAAHAVKLQVKRARGYYRGAFSDALCKRLALVSMMLSMPEGAEACQGHRCASVVAASVFSFVIAAVCILRALSLEGTEAQLLQACLVVVYMMTECFGSSLGTAVGDNMWMIVASMIAAALAAALGVYMYMVPTLRASHERVQALETQVDAQESELVNLRDKVVHLRQCLVDTSSQASQFAHGEQLQVNAKHDMAREIHGLKHDIKVLERELVKARAATAPPTAVYYTSERGHCYHHESCHHVRNNASRHRLVACTQCTTKFRG